MQDRFIPQVWCDIADKAWKEYMSRCGWLVEKKAEGDMTEEELIEQLADKEHASWARWMRYVFDLGKTNEDGSFTIPAASASRWLRQANTDYKELSEQEKQSDRNEVAHILSIIHEYAHPVDN
jgi:hypothetical protein